MKKTDKTNATSNLLRARLEGEFKRLTEEMEQLKSTMRPADERREGSPFGKREEEATESYELERRLTLEKSIREQLAAVEHAIQKFDDGTYGLCDSCGKPIPPERLEALPQATLCLDCKERQAKDVKGK